MTDIQSKIKLFADDTSLYLIVDDPNETTDSLNNELTKIHDWATKWLVTFNAQKTETMTISRKIDKPDHPPLYMDSNDISTVSEYKHLGIVISDNGSWEKHIDMITGKAYKRINILRKFKFILDRKTLEKIDFIFVRPLLEYADVIWDNMIISLNTKIENVQLEDSRIVTGGTRLVSHNKLYTATGWEKLKDRREKHKLVQFYKMTKKLTPHYISCLVPQAFANIHDYSTRNASVLPVVRSRTSLYYNSCIPSSVRLWNLQPDNIRLSPSIQALKYSLKSNISSKPFYYYTGIHLGQILHSRLRMQCSSLNQHVYRKNIVDSPNCICGLTESTTYYLFHCPRYTAQRQMHINSINVPINLTT